MWGPSGNDRGRAADVLLSQQRAQGVVEPPGIEGDAAKCRTAAARRQCCAPFAPMMDRFLSRPTRPVSQRRRGGKKAESGECGASGSGDPRAGRLRPFRGHCGTRPSIPAYAIREGSRVLRPGAGANPARTHVESVISASSAASSASRNRSVSDANRARRSPVMKSSRQSSRPFSRSEPITQVARHVR